jgi:2-hydroxycyclohexanecarboxyl-CoA dehydrogenase
MNECSFILHCRSKGRSGRIVFAVSARRFDRTTNSTSEQGRKMKLDGKTAVISGGASGIGRATAETLARAGAHVLLGDIDETRGAEVAAAIVAMGFGADFLKLDVTDLASIEAFRREALRLRDCIDIVANVAGWGKIQPFMENTPEFWRKVIDLNLLGPVALSRAFLDSMIAQGGGKIVTVASDAGRVGSLGESVYAGAKGGAIAFTKSLAREVARYSINVNCVCPGPTDTPLLAAVPEKHRDAFVRVTPMRRLARPSEIADAVLFFSSGRADFVTGQVLSVSGGLTMAG